MTARNVSGHGQMSAEFFHGLTFFIKGSSFLISDCKLLSCVADGGFLEGGRAFTVFRLRLT